MPYRWTDTPQGPEVLFLKAHRSLPEKGFAGVILFMCAMLFLPLATMLGTVVVWWMLPFFALAVWALWAALRRSYRDGEVSETLTRAGDVLRLTHRPARGAEETWECNHYWARAELHKTGGPVENYVTLSGSGRQVEIGRFLSEDERVALYHELTSYLSPANA